MAATKAAAKPAGKGFDFTNVEAATENNFLKPGIYTMKVTSVELGAFPKGSKYLGITFSTQDELSLVEKMGYESDKARSVFLSRLQYLHEAWTGSKLSKAFKSVDEIASYFSKLFASPNAKPKNVIIGGEIDGDKVWARLPFTAFVTDEGPEVFEEGDDNWKKHVRKSNKKSEAAGAKNGVLNDSEDNDGGGEEAGEEEEKGDGLPW